MSNFFFMFHSGLRYLVLLAGVVTLVALLAGLSRRPVAAPAQTAWRVFLGLLDLQVLIGLIVVFTRPFFPALMGHITMMAAALIVGHLNAVTFRRKPAEKQTAAHLLAGTVICLALIVAGILAIGRPIV